MKITKLVHSCLLVEMPAPVNRTALFDPGVMSQHAIDIDSLEYLDNIIITHDHSDHFSPELIGRLLAKFPRARVTAPPRVVSRLQAQQIAGDEPVSEETPGIVLFESPHESVEPLFPQPEQIGVHYLDMLTHPGDSHSFAASKAILALPVTAPWGATVRAVNLALELKPRHVIPIHDWHWSDAARAQMYDGLADAFRQHGIEFHKMETGVPVVIEV